MSLCRGSKSQDWYRPSFALPICDLMDWLALNEPRSKQPYVAAPGNSEANIPAAFTLPMITCVKMDGVLE